MSARNVAAAIGLLALGALAAHILWPIPPDKRAAPWLARETVYRGRLAALTRDTAQLAARVDSLKSVSRRYYNAASDTIMSAAARLDTVILVLDTSDCDSSSTQKLRAVYAILRNAQQIYAMAHEADSLALNAAARHRAILELRLGAADSLIAASRPIIAAARQPRRCTLGVAAIYGFRGRGADLGLGVVCRLIP